MKISLDENINQNSPWHSCMEQLTWGILLSFITISLPTFPLPQVTTLLGAFLVVNGLFQVREGNSSLHKAYHFGIAYFAFRCLAIVIGQFDNEIFLIYFAGISCIIQTILLYRALDNVENGMYEANRIPELVEPIACSYGKIKKSLIAITAVSIFSTYVVELSWLGFFILIALVISIIKNLSPVDLTLLLHIGSKEDQVSRNDRRGMFLIVGVCLVAVVTLVPVVRYISLLKPLQPYESSTSSEGVEDIMQQMKKAGFPDEILSQLSPEEIANYKGITKVVVRKNAEFSYSEYSDEVRNLEEEDLNKLEVTFVYSYFNEKGDFSNGVRVLCYGKWTGMPNHTFTDYFYLNSDDNTWAPVVYGIYTKSSGEDAYYDIEQTTLKSENNWFGFGDTHNPYFYTIPTSGSNYRFIASQTVIPGTNNYDEDEDELEEEDKVEQTKVETDLTKEPIYYTLSYYHRYKFAKWMKMDLFDYRDVFYEQRQYYVDQQ